MAMNQKTLQGAESPAGKLERVGNSSVALFFTCLRELCGYICILWGSLAPTTCSTLVFHKMTQASEEQYIMKLMCCFCPNITNDKLAQLGKGAAGMLTQICLPPSLCLFHLHTLQRNSSVDYRLSGYLFFPCLICIYVGSRNKPKSKRNQD